MTTFDDLSDEPDLDAAEERVDERFRRRSLAERSCSDRMCGANDCPTCHPESA